MDGWLALGGMEVALLFLEHLGGWGEGNCAVEVLWVEWLFGSWWLNVLNGFKDTRGVVVLMVV